MNTEIPDFGRHYTAIGQLLVDLLPKDFQKAFAGIEREQVDDTWSADVFYLKKNGRYGLYEDVDGINKLFNEFVNLENAYKDAGLASWTTATFCLTATGKMTLDLGYDDVSDFDTAPERRNEWIKKYIGDILLIDWPE
ncbi:MAG: antitoxin YezG family protein [Zoogloeaceae bacterium]|jgi:hypothetical protein|nr:antitoxin YezG family protein [Zoogloeaceae bacterium]